MCSTRGKVARLCIDGWRQSFSDVGKLLFSLLLLFFCFKIEFIFVDVVDVDVDMCVCVFPSLSLLFSVCSFFRRPFFESILVYYKFFLLHSDAADFVIAVFFCFHPIPSFSLFSHCSPSLALLLSLLMCRCVWVFFKCIWWSSFGLFHIKNESLYSNGYAMNGMWNGNDDDEIKVTIEKQNRLDVQASVSSSSSSKV